MRLGWELSRLAGDAVPVGGREGFDRLRGPEWGHPLVVVRSGFRFGLGGFAVGHRGGRAFFACYNGVLQLDLERGGAEGFARGGPLDLEEGGDAGGVGRKGGLDRFCKQIKYGVSGGRQSEKIGIRECRLERDGDLGACGRGHGGTGLDHDDLEGHLVAAF